MMSSKSGPGFPISKRIRNSSNAKEFLNVSLTGNGILLIRGIRERRGVGQDLGSRSGAYGNDGGWGIRERRIRGSPFGEG
ncbi:MAG: hypothetical protein LLF78_06045 [Synergistaceae bacterium]|nr:hypothetical protein [Synergistaceae bacterium]